MEIIHVIIILLITIMLLNMMNGRSHQICKSFTTKSGHIVEICSSQEYFDIPLSPKEMCESRCQTNFDHAQ